MLSRPPAGRGRVRFAHLAEGRRGPKLRTSQLAKGGSLSPLRSFFSERVMRLAAGLHSSTRPATFWPSLYLARALSETRSDTCADGTSPLQPHTRPLAATKTLALPRDIVWQ
jgi:hypothetical protein